jgi:cephalosporin hydroxylase
MDPIEEFKKEREIAIEKMSKDEKLKEKSLDWILHAAKYDYTYNFNWLGRPIIKYPNDIIFLQEIIWEVKPEIIIETGIAHGGSIIFSASMLELIGGDGKVIAIDIDIRKHNREEIEAHSQFKRIELLEGSSISEEIVQKVAVQCKDKSKVMVCLDSLHTHDHVLGELRAYAPYVNVGSYILVSDTIIEYFPKGHFTNRPWDVGNNPYSALKQFLDENDNFIMVDLEKKLLISDGFCGCLKRIK